MTGYSVIYADPAWRFETFSDKGKGRAPEQHYETMTIAEMAALPVASWAERDAALFLWGY